MTTLEAVQNGLAAWPQPRVEGERVIVTSRSLYPSMSAVLVYVDGGENAAVVSDGGGALDEVERAVQFDPGHVKSIAKMVRNWGLEVNSNGWIHTKQIAYKNISSAIAIVTSASVDTARALLKRARPKRQRDYRVELDGLLNSKFRGYVHRNVKLVGESNRQHVFDYMLTLPGGKKLIMDAVTHDANSVNSAIVSHLDIRNRQAGEPEQENYVQRIIYNDKEEWDSSDLSLLATGATPVAFTKIASTLDRLAV